MTTTDQPSIATLREIETRVLWLASRIIDAANRRGDSDIKVGGQQASSASIATIMTALWFAHLDRDDKVAVKPHASPVYHAIKYLTGELDARYLTTPAPARRAPGLPVTHQGPRRRRLLHRLRRPRSRRPNVLRSHRPLPRQPRRQHAHRTVHGARR